MTTTIRIKRTTKKKLENLGKKTDSFDDIINKLIENYDPLHAKENEKIIKEYLKDAPLDEQSRILFELR